MSNRPTVVTPSSAGIPQLREFPVVELESEPVSGSMLVLPDVPSDVELSVSDVDPETSVVDVVSAAPVLPAVAVSLPPLGVASSSVGQPVRRARAVKHVQSRWFGIEL